MNLHAQHRSFACSIHYKYKVSLNSWASWLYHRYLKIFFLRVIMDKVHILQRARKEIYNTRGQISYYKEVWMWWAHCQIVRVTGILESALRAIRNQAGKIRESCRSMTRMITANTNKGTDYGESGKDVGSVDWTWKSMCYSIIYLDYPGQSKNFVWRTECYWPGSYSAILCLECWVVWAFQGMTWIP